MAEKMSEEEYKKIFQVLVRETAFKRLNDVKQLGNLHKTFGEKITHTRLSYSIRLFQKAKKMAQQLHENQPELNITKQDVMCVALAGLCYNLGQPPLSYDFWRIRNKRYGFFDEDELLDQSCKLLDDIWPMITKMDVLNHDKVELSEKDKAFVKALMRGKNKSPKMCTDGHPLRQEGKDFLYEIVNNKYNGLDVKLFTYLVEDAKSLQIKEWSSTCTEIEKMMETAKVIFINEDGTTRSHIAYSDEFRHLIVQLFQKKEYLHRTVYQNPEHRAKVIQLSDAYTHHMKFAPSQFSLTDEQFLAKIFSQDPSKEQKCEYKLAAQASVLVKKKNLSQMKELAKIQLTYDRKDTMKVDVVDYSDSYLPDQIWIYNPDNNLQAYSMASPHKTKSIRSEEYKTNQGDKKEKVQLQLDDSEHYPYTECSIRWYAKNPNDGETFMGHQQLLEKKCKCFNDKQVFFDAVNSTHSIWSHPLTMAGWGLISGFFLLPEIRRLTCRIIVRKEKLKYMQRKVTTFCAGSTEATPIQSFIQWLQKMMSTEPGTLTPLMRTQGNVFKWLQIIFWFTTVGLVSSLVHTYLEMNKKTYKFTTTKTKAVSWGVLGVGCSTVAIMAESKSNFKIHVMDAQPKPRRWMLYGSYRGSPLKAIVIGLLPVIAQQLVHHFSQQSIPDSYG